MPVSSIKLLDRALSRSGQDCGAYSPRISTEATDRHGFNPLSSLSISPCAFNPPNGSWGMVKACHYPYFDEFLARGCWRQNKAWGGARQRGTPGVRRNQSHQARKAGGSFLLFDLS